MNLCKYRKKAKTGRHCFKYEGKRHSLVPGDTIEVPEGFLGSFEKDYDCLTVVKSTPEPIKIEEPIAPPKELHLIRVQRGMYNIINPDNPDKPLNDAPMKKKDAEAIMGKMMEIPKTEIVDLGTLGWDALIGIMEDEGIEILEEYESEDQLREAILIARG